jgi:hypothetical protein
MPITITPIPTNPSILDAQESQLVASREMTRYFGLINDYIQLFIYNRTNQIVSSNLDFQTYTVTENKEVSFDPSVDIVDQGIRLGTYTMVYNFQRPILTINPNLDLFLKTISQDRTEVKVATTTDNNIFYTNIITYINTIQSRNYFLEFYLDFGNNNLVPCISIAAEQDVTNGNSYAIIKLLNPLSETITINSPLNVIEKIINTQEFQAVLTSDVITSENSLPSLREANFSLDVDAFRIGSSDYYNYNQILNYTSSEFQNLLTFISSSNPTINVDYNDYENFIHFGSAAQQLETFQYKLTQIETYASYVTSYPTSPDTILYQQQLDSVIQGFDAYENFLYFESGSKSWPKYPGDKPYVNYSVTSSQGINWYNLNYTSASYYDEFNNNNLIYGLPTYIQESPTFDSVAPFVYSMGQMFDEIWLYIKAMTDLWKADNGLNQGISKDIVGDALQSLGIALYTDGDQDNIYEWLYGSNQSGTQTFVTQSWQTGITASQYTLSGQDEAKSVFKRIYSNLPTLLKSKGANKFINYLNTLYGIPDTILFPMEFGGIDKTSNTAEYNYSRFTYALQFSSSKNVVVQNNSSNAYGIESLEFRFKPNPNGSTQTLIKGTGNEYNISLVPTTSASYNYANVVLAVGSNTSSVSLPIYVTGSDGSYNWWNVAWINSGTGSILYVKNELNGEIGWQASVLNASPVYDNSATEIQLSNNNYVGQIQELRGWTTQLSESVINSHTLNPESYVGNTTNSAYDDLLFRFPLGNDLLLLTSNVTGSQPQLTTDYELVFTGFSSSDYVSFTEQYYTQPAVGGYSVPNTDKIRIESQNVATYRLQPLKSVVYNSPTSSRTNDIGLSQVGFSPQDQINNDIIAQLGTTYNLDQIIGDPRYSDLNYYPGLGELQEEYFEKYVSPYNYKDFIQLIETYHKSLFRYLETYIPGRTNNTSGVVIKPHILERSKTRRYEPTINTASYDGQTETVAIVGSNSGDYCCSRNSAINEAFFDGELSGSEIEIWSAYDQNNPFTRAICDCHRYQVTTDGQIAWIDCNGETKVDSSISQRVVQLTACKDKVVAVGSTNFYLQDLGRFSDNQAFVEQYEGWDALDNNVVPNVQSQFKFKTLPTSQSINVNALGNCVRYRVWNLGVSGGTPASASAASFFTYQNCNTGTPVLCNTVFATPFPSYNPNFIYVEAIEGSVAHDNGIVSPCSGPFAPANNFKVDFDGYVRMTDNRVFNYYSQSIEWQDTNLSDAGYVKSREIGSSTTALNFNQTFNYTSSIVDYNTTYLGNNAYPNAEQTIDYILYYDWAGSTLAEKQGSANYHIRYLIDQTGSVFKPEYSSSYYYNVDQGFGAYTPVNVSIYNSLGVNNSTQTTVYRPLKQFQTIIYTNIGSLGNNYLVSGSYTSISFEVPSYNYQNPFQFRANESTGFTISSGTTVTASFNNVILDQANGFNVSSNVYNAPFSSLVRAKFTGSIYIVNSNITTSTNVTVKWYKNNNIVYTSSVGLAPNGSAGDSNTFLYEDVISYVKDDDYYATVYTSATDVDYNINPTLTLWEINPLTSSFTVSRTNIFTTGSASKNILTGSANLSIVYSGYQQTPIANSGYDTPQDFILRQYDEIVFEGNENKVYTIMSVNISTGTLYVYLDRPIASGTDVTNFSIRRLANNPGFVILNTPNIEGPGFIIPKYMSPTLKNNLNNIISDLSSKGLIP